MDSSILPEEPTARAQRHPMFAAHYHETTIPAHQGNPLIETLPPLWTRAELRTLLRRIPAYAEEDRLRRTAERLQLMLLAERFFQPLPQHLELAETVATMIRDGYVGRNPAQPAYLPNALQRLPSVLAYHPDEEEEPLATPGFTLIGESGIGKTRSFSRMLRLFPQVIVHSVYRGQRFSHLQVVYLQVICPQDGSRKALCIEFFRAIDRCLGTAYYERYAGSRATIDTLLIAMANVCLLHHIGLLVIDEVQNLREAKAQDANAMLNFFTQLDNQIQAPVVLIGTPRARPILTGGFRRARRAEGQGGFIWEKMRRDSIWDLFLDTLWRYQYTGQRTELTPQLREAMYDASQGIAAIAIKLYFLTQERVISRGTERVTLSALRATARERLQFVKPFLDALRKNDRKLLENDPRFDDLMIPIEDEAPMTLENDSASQTSASAEPAESAMPTARPSGAMNAAPAGTSQDTSQDTSPDGAPERASAAGFATAAQESSAASPIANGESAGAQRGARRPIGQAAGGVANTEGSSTTNRAARANPAGKQPRASGGSKTRGAESRSGLLHTFETRGKEVAPYDAFLAAGYIRSVMEYLEEPA